MIAFLPAYSSELNPDEQVRNHAKAEVGKEPIKSNFEMKILILSAKLSIQQKIELVKIFFIYLIHYMRKSTQRDECEYLWGD